MFERSAARRAGKPFRALTACLTGRVEATSGTRRAGGSVLALLASAALGFASCAAPEQEPPGQEGIAGSTPSGGAAGASGTKASPLENSLAPFVPSPLQVVRRMLDLAQVTEDDVLYDLGSGDGRIVVEAARLYGARAVGIEYDLRLCEEARERAAREGVSHLVEFRHEDVLEADFSDATVVTLYLLPASNVRLRSKLLALRPGTRIVAHNYGIEGWDPIVTAVVETRDYEKHLVLLWEVGR